MQGSRRARVWKGCNFYCWELFFRAPDGKQVEDKWRNTDLNICLYWRMRKILTRPWVGVRVCHLLLFFFSLNSALNKLFIFSLLSEFNRISLGYLDQCFRTNEELTQKLLMYKPKDWTEQTCLSLAYSIEHEEFLAHGICQALLTDIWTGEMKTSQESSLKVRLFGAHSSALCFQPLN